MIAHRLIWDKWSSEVFTRELGALYDARSRDAPSPLPALAVQYADYAVWQRGWLRGEILERQLAYWREQLSDVPVLDLPTDHPRPAVPGFRMARAAFSLEPKVRTALLDLGKQQDATLFIVLLAAFQLLLSRWSGQKNIAVGSPVACRTKKQAEGLIGSFANTVLLRTDILDDLTFFELVERVREVVRAAYAHQDVPFEMIIAELQPPRHLSRQPVFQVMFALQNLLPERFEFPGLTLQSLELPQTLSQLDLLLNVAGQEGSLEGFMDYAVDLFEKDTIECMIEDFSFLLRTVIDDPNRRISLLPTPRAKPNA
jgi:hypothetical protein